MNADGTGPTQLTRTQGVEEKHPSWRPDGEWLAYVSREPFPSDRQDQIFLMKNDGTEQRLTAFHSPFSDASAPAWSPTGRTIAFVSNQDSVGRSGGYRAIYQGAPDAVFPQFRSPRQALTAATSNDQDPAWSPDAHQIAFTSDRNGNHEIYRMNVDGSALQNLTHNSANDEQPAWSPDGRSIVFVADRDGNHEIYRMNVDGSAPQNLTHDPAEDQQPTWSPDGAYIAFVSNRQGNQAIYVLNLVNGQVQRLITHLGNDSEPAWWVLPAAK